MNYRDPGDQDEPGARRRKPEKPAEPDLFQREEGEAPEQRDEEAEQQHGGGKRKHRK